VRHRRTGDVARTVLAEVGRAGQLVLVQGLRLQRLQATDVVRTDSEAVTYAPAELVVAHEEVPHHPLLHRADGLADGPDQVGHQAVLLPLLHELAALPGPGVVVGQGDALAGEPAGDDLPLLVMGRVLGPTRAAGDRRLVGHMRVRAGAEVHAERHLPPR
jgi:hypothetical protein